MISSSARPHWERGRISHGLSKTRKAIERRPCFRCPQARDADRSSTVTSATSCWRNFDSRSKASKPLQTTLRRIFASSPEVRSAAKSGKIWENTGHTLRLRLSSAKKRPNRYENLFGGFNPWRVCGIFDRQELRIRQHLHPI